MSPRTVFLVSCTTLTACAPQDDASFTAHAGLERHGVVGQRVELDGSASLGATWEWALLETPAGSALEGPDLLDADTPWASFVPDAEGAYVLELWVCETPDLCAVDHTVAWVGELGQALQRTHRLLPGGWLEPLGARPGALAPALVGARPAGTPVGVHDDDPIDFKGPLALPRDRQITGGWTLKGAPTPKKPTAPRPVTDPPLLAPGARPLGDPAEGTPVGLWDDDPWDFKGPLSIPRDRQITGGWTLKGAPTPKKPTAPRPVTDPPLLAPGARPLGDPAAGTPVGVWDDDPWDFKGPLSIPRDRQITGGWSLKGAPTPK